MKCSESGRVSHSRLRSLMPAGIILILVAFLVANFSTLVFGQGATGAINGTVTDASGAVIPQAKVALHNVATGVETTTATNGVGLYVFPSLLPGRYTLLFSKEGFATANQAEFTLDVDQTLTFNITMPVASTVKEITVSSTAAHVESSTAELGTAIEQTDVNNLPLNGRNFTQLLELTPGVSPISTGQNSGGGGGFAGNSIGTFTFPSVNGQTNRSDMWLLDGFVDYAFVGNYGVQPDLESIQEFKVQSHNDDSSYGQALGGIVNVVMKSGTSQYHGSTWEFLRNNDLDARNTFVANVTPYRQNQFGGSIGGPLLPQSFRSAAPRSFFFASYEGFRSSRAAEVLFTTVTPQELQGDFSASSLPIYNPYSNTVNPSNPSSLISTVFTGNQIDPTKYYDPTTVALAKALFPAPVATSIPGINGIDTTPNVVRQDSATLRFDHQFSDRTSGWVRYLGNSQPDVMSGGIPSEKSDLFLHGYQAAGAVTHTFGDGREVAVFRFGRTSMQDNVEGLFPGIPGNLWQEAGFNPTYATGFLGGATYFPAPTIGSFLSASGSFYQGNHATDVYEWAGDFSIIRGHHTMRMGADINTNDNQQPFGAQSETFSSFQTSDPSNPGVTGNAMASFLLGIPSAANRRAEYASVHGGWVDGFYFMDEWRATNKLQVNIGLRYDVTFWPIYGTLKEGNLYLGDTDLDTGQYLLSAVPPACGNGVSAPCIPGGTLPANVIVTPLKDHAFIHNTHDNWQPRLGLAYRLLPGTVIRASAGRFYDNWADTLQKSTDQMGTWPSVTFLENESLNSYTTQSPTPTAFAQDPFNFGSAPTILPAPTPFSQVTTFVDPYFHNAYSDQWNFGVQHQLGANTVIEANYVGSADSRLESGCYRNTAVTPGPGNPQDRAPYPYIAPTWYDESIGRSSYNAFQFKMERTSRAATYLISYTWSKTMDIGCDNYTASEGCSVEDPYNYNNNESVAGYDVTHLLSVAGVYPLPFGKGERFQAGSQALNAIVGNWKLNGIFSARSGVPFNINLPGDVANTGNLGYYERPNIIGPAFDTPRTATNFLNTADIVSPAQYTFGNMGRNALRTPPVANFDLSLFKVFPLPLSESTKLEFRAEFFNAFNFQALGAPDSTIGDPTFGQVLATAQTEREIQFALKLYF